MSKILGIDVGGVIISRGDDKGDTSFFTDNFLKTKAEENAFDIIKILKGKFDEVYIVSKCGYKVQQKTLQWFEYHNFYERTEVSPKNVFFCIQRHEKAPICERLGITHFIDDKLEVLSYLNTVDNKFLFKPSQREVDKYRDYLSRVKRVESWEELYAKI